MQSRVHVTVERPSVRLCPIDRRQQRRAAGVLQSIRTYWSIAARRLQQLRRAARRSAANAGSVMLTADEHNCEPYKNG